MREIFRTRGRYNELAGTSLERLAGISDGIFSVGMTLLVLGLVVPTAASIKTQADLWHALQGFGPNILIYFLSFMTLGIFWVGQGTQLGQLQRGNRHYTWIQLAFLLAVTLVPFSTALLARYPTFKVALLEYWLNILVLGLLLWAGLEYALRAGLLREQRGGEAVRLMRGRIVSAQLLYAIAIALSIFLPNWVSITLIVLIQLNYVIAPRIPILDRF